MAELTYSDWAEGVRRWLDTPPLPPEQWLELARRSLGEQAVYVGIDTAREGSDTTAYWQYDFNRQAWLPTDTNPGFITGDWSVEYPPIAEPKKHAGIFPRQAMTEGWRGR